MRTHMKKIKYIRTLVSSIVAISSIYFLYFINNKMETMQPAEYVSSIGIYFLVYVAFVFIVSEIYGLLKKLESKDAE